MPRPISPAPTPGSNSTSSPRRNCSPLGELPRTCAPTPEQAEEALAIVYGPGRHTGTGLSALTGRDPLVHPVQPSGNQIHHHVLADPEGNEFRAFTE
jgi:hypothetical protein